MVHPFPPRESLTRPGVLLGALVLAAGVALTLLDNLYGIFLLAVGLLWFGAALSSTNPRTGATGRR